MAHRKREFALRYEKSGTGEARYNVLYILSVIFICHLISSQKSTSTIIKITGGIEPWILYHFFSEEWQRRTSDVRRQIPVISLLFVRKVVHSELDIYSRTAMSENVEDRKRQVAGQ